MAGARRSKVRSLAEVKHLLDTRGESIGLRVRVHSMDGVCNAGAAFFLLDFKRSPEEGAWDVRHLGLLQPMAALNDVVRLAVPLLEKISDSLENHTRHKTRSARLRNVGILMRELDLSSLSACTVGKRGDSVPDKATSLALDICNVAELVIEQFDGILIDVGSLRRRVERFMSARVYIRPPAQVDAVEGFVRPENLRPINSLRCATALVNEHGNEQDIRARIFSLNGIAKAAQVLDLLRDRVNNGAWDVFNAALLPPLITLYDHLVQSKGLCKKLAKSIEKEEPLKEDRPQRLRALADTLGGPNLSALDTCFFQHEGDELPEEVTRLARKICDVADMFEPLQSPNLAIELAREVAQDITHFLTRHVFMDADPADA